MSDAATPIIITSFKSIVSRAHAYAVRLSVTF